MASVWQVLNRCDNFSISSLRKMVSILQAGCFSGASMDLKISLATICLFEASWIFMFSSLNDYHPDANEFLAKMVGYIFPAVWHVMHIIVLAWLDVDGASIRCQTAQLFV